MPLELVKRALKVYCDAVIGPIGCHTQSGDTALVAPSGSRRYKYSIDTEVPDWETADFPRRRLANYYTVSLQAAAENGCESVGVRVFEPFGDVLTKSECMEIALRAISAFLCEHEMTVYLVTDSEPVSDRDTSKIYRYISDNYIEPDAAAETDADTIREAFADKYLKAEKAPQTKLVNRDYLERTAQLSMRYELSVFEDILKNLDKGFAETLFYYIDKKSYTDVECYKMSNINKKTFSKIKCNPDYKPSKYMVLAFAIGLRLELEEAKHLLSTAGLCLSHSDKFDLIVEYFLKTGNYTDIYEVNEVLYSFDLELLGSV